MERSKILYGSNTPYVDEIFKEYQKDPNSVSPEWRSFFEEVDRTGDASPVHFSVPVPKGQQVAVAQGHSAVGSFINAYRSYGHRSAAVNPLEAPEMDSALTFESHGLTEADLNKEFATEGLLKTPTAKLSEIHDALKKTYTSSIGVQYQDIGNMVERRWLREKMESTHNQPTLTAEGRLRIYEGLNQANKFERYLHTKFVGAKRFSIEGGDAMIPSMQEMLEQAGVQGIEDVVLGMAHRGRLNVLAHIMQKPLEAIFSEFAGTVQKEEGDDSQGDVKYHMGKSYDVKTKAGKDVHISLLANPSHLELVNPVVEGSARAKQDKKSPEKVLPVLIHGDAAFIGQGVVAETLNLSTLKGYSTGGTLHIVINNQVGFTAVPEETVGTEYCTDFCRMLQVPIFHVNGDDPEACVHVMRLAMEYRERFGKDVVIDIVCYRRHGHNEGDDPTFTNPVMYQKIKKHKVPADVYKQKLLETNAVTEEALKEIEADYDKALKSAYEVASKDGFKAKADVFTRQWSDFSKEEKQEPKTQLSKKELEEVASALETPPTDFTVNPKVMKLMERRAEMYRKGDIDWGAGEMLAYAGLLKEGYSVRLSGQDCKRGTFSHRHAVLKDSNTGAEWLPINSLSDTAQMDVHNSSLSEEAVLGFEFGYSLADPKTLTIWEAQFGDFANGAQNIIDQFISSSETKWHRYSGLVMLLPHGMEGQGPEHSSARLERYLQLCADNNMTVMNPTTPAQIFHALRRQALRKTRRPLIVMSPKSLLRHPEAVSSLEEMTKGVYTRVIADDKVDAKKVKRVLLCSGKVYYDLEARRKEDKNADKVAIVRVEQLYPLPERSILDELAKYKNAEVCWVQEEARNYGAWTFMLDNLGSQLSRPLRYIGRKAAASPAVGTMGQHNKEQQNIIEEAFNVK